MVQPFLVKCYHYITKHAYMHTHDIGQGIKVHLPKQVPLVLDETPSKNALELSSSSELYFIFRIARALVLLASVLSNGASIRSWR